MSTHPGRRRLAGRVSSQRRATPTIATLEAHQPVAPCSQEVATDRDTEPLLYTAEQAAELLQVRPSWLRRKATAHAVPCRFLGKHLRFARADIDAIADASLQPARRPSNTHRTIRH
jgi:Helix-turn-helix domain